MKTVKKVFVTEEVETHALSSIHLKIHKGEYVAISESVITDDQWHRIGLVWDDSNRTLYVDDVMVAEDTQDGLESSIDGLYIGCGKAMEVGTFFSGLIDNVRIYNRAVRP